MDSLIDVTALEIYAESARGWISTELLTIAALWQAGVIVVAFGAALLMTPPFRGWLRRRVDEAADESRLSFVCSTFINLVTPVLWVILLWLAVEIADRSEWPNKLLSIVVSLVNAWIVIHLVSRFVTDAAWTRFIAVTIWVVAALNIVELLQPALNLLDGIALQVGTVRVTALSLAKGMFTLVVLLWLANLVSGILERRIQNLPTLTPSIQVLFAKLLKISLIVIAGVVAIDAVGIDLTAFAVFGGALGVGIGFGLQKIVANFISGIILLLDKSIKPGDTIGVSGTYGWIQSLGARYVSVITRDGIEHLIPNEELITTRVENWSFSNLRIRQKIPVGVSYSSDVRASIEMCVEAAAANPRVLASPNPICLLKGFGDSSVDLEVRFWVVDPQNGLSNVKSDILLDIWDRFHENGIQIPFPQRDLHLKSVAPEVRAAGLQPIANPPE
ncbi:MAG: mechanosensitive ion channel [Alphaproteobacteria bacterium]|nr:mechanosensitive ion channel [Alphaproteobacteria bacterium]